MGKQGRTQPGCKDALPGATINTSSTLGWQDTEATNPLIREIYSALGALSENVASAIPDRIKERVLHLNHNQILSMTPQELLCTLEKVLMRVPWDKTVPEDRDGARRFLEASRYTASLAAGDPKGETPCAMQEVALEQAARTAAFFVPALRRVLEQIPVPEAPRPAPQPIPSPPLPAALARTEEMGEQHQLHRANSRLAEMRTILAAALSTTLAVAITVARNTAALALLLSALAARGLAPLIRPLAKGLSNLMESLGRRLQGLGSGIGGGIRNLGNGSLPPRIFSESRTLFDSLLKKLGLPGTGGRQKSGGENPETETDTISTNADRKKAHIIEELEDKPGAASFSGLSGFSLSQFSLPFLKRNPTVGRINTRNFSLYQGLTFVTGVYAVSGRAGELTRLDLLLKDKADPAAKGALEEIYRLKKVCGEVPHKPAEANDALISLPVRPVPPVFNLPLPCGFEVQALEFLDAEGNVLPGKRELAECVFGGAIVRVPARARKVSYLIAPSKQTLSPETAVFLQQRLPGFPIYSGLLGDAFKEALLEFQLTDTERTRNWMQYLALQGFTYSKNYLVGSFLRTAGNGLCEAMTGLKAGTCDSFSFLLAATLREQGLTALSINGLVTDDRGLSFKLDEGHAQTAVLCDASPTVMDLTGESRKAAIDYLGAAGTATTGILHKLRKASFKEIHELGEELREKLFGRARAKDSPVRSWVNEVADRIGPESNLVSRLRHRRQGSSDKLYRAVLSTAQYLALQKGLSDARDSANPATLFRLSDDLPRSIESTSVADPLLPEKYAHLANFDLLSPVIDLATEFLRNGACPRETQELCYNWLKKKLPPSEMAFRSSTSSREFRSLQTFTPPLSLQHAAAFVESLQLEKLENRELLELIARTSLLPLHIYSSASYQVAVPPEAHRLAFAQAFNRLARELETRKLEISEELKLAFAKRLAFIQGQYPCQGANTQYTQSIGSALQAIYACPGGNPLLTSLELLHRDPNWLYQSLLEALRSEGIDPLANSRGPDAKWQRAELAQQIEKDLFRKGLGFQEIAPWKRTLETFRDLDFPLSEVISLENVQKFLRNELQSLEELSGRKPINYPSLHNPASFLLARMQPDLRSARAFQFIELLAEHHLTDADSLIPFWPQSDEAEHAADLCKNISLNNSNLSLNRLHSEGFESYEKREIKLAHSRPLQEQFLSRLERLHPLRGLLRLSHSKGTWADAALEAVFSRFELTVPPLDDQCARASLEELLQAHSNDEIYRSWLWCAAQRLTTDGRNRAGLIAQSLKAGEFRDMDQACSAAETGFAPPQSISPLLKDISSRCRLVSLVFSELLNAPDIRGRATWEESPYPSIRERMKDAARVLLVDPPSVQALPALAPVWSRIHGLLERTPINVRPYADMARRRVDLLSRRLPDLWARYLYGRTGRAVVAASVGDFSDLKAFADGDDIRRIDWRRYAKDEKLLVRKFVDEETRPVTLILDAELFTKDLREISRRGWESECQKICMGKTCEAYEPKSITDLFSILELAARENFDLDIVFFGRVRLQTIEGAVKRNRQGTRGTYDLGQVSKEISEAIRQAMALDRFERAVYRNGEEFQSVDIFAEGTGPLKKGRLNLIGISSKNLALSSEIVPALRARGEMAALLFDINRQAP